MTKVWCLQVSRNFEIKSKKRENRRGRFTIRAIRKFWIFLYICMLTYAPLLNNRWIWYSENKFENFANGRIYFRVIL